MVLMAKSMLSGQQARIYTLGYQRYTVVMPSERVQDLQLALPRSFRNGKAKPDGTVEFYVTEKAAQQAKDWCKANGVLVLPARERTYVGNVNKETGMNKTAVAKELVAVAKTILGGGWRHYSEDLCDVLEALPMVHKGRDNHYILFKVHQDKELLQAMRDEGMTDRELMQLLNDAREMYQIPHY